MGNHKFGKVFWLTGVGVSLAFPQIPWYMLKNQPGATLEQVKEAFEMEEEAREASEARDLTSLLQKDPELYEEDEGDIQYQRWLNYVEPRVGASGDLSQLNILQQEVLKTLPLDGNPAPAMAGDWKPLGPAAAATAGAGRLNWIEFHPTDRNSFMVGSPGGGLWMTTDGGKSWITTTEKIAVLGVAWAVYHPTDPNIIFLGTGDGDHSDTKSVGLLKSSDGGKTWATTGLTYQISANTQIAKVAIDPKNGNNIFVATSSGLQVSHDGGVTFKAATGITGRLYDVEINPANSSVVYASTTNFYVSTNGGDSFTSGATGITAAGARMQLAITAANADYVYALRGAQASTQGVYRSSDQGKTFTQTGAGTEIGCNQTWYDYGFGASPTNANELAAGCLNVFRSTDGGGSWTTTSQGVHVDVHGTLFRQDGVLFAVSDGGIWMNNTPPGGTFVNTFTNLNNNLDIGQSYRVGVMHNDWEHVCTGRQDNGSDIRIGSGGFKRALGADGFECFWNSDGTRWYGESQNGGFSSNCPYTMATGAIGTCNKGVPSAAGSWDTPWGADPKSPQVVYAGRGANMWKSTDGGANWTQMGTMTGSSVRNFTVAFSNPQVIYAYKGSSVFKTSDGGGSWTALTGTSGTIMNGAISETDPNDVWVCASGYTAGNKVFHSTNGGPFTNETGTGLPNIPANAVALDNMGQNGVYVGMDAGIYFKQNGTTQWQNFSDGLPNARVMELEIARKGSDNASDKRIVAATFGRGIWRSPLFGIVGIKRAAKLPPLAGFKAGLTGSRLDLHFQLGSGKREEGATSMLLTTLDGKAVYQEKLPNYGIFDKQIDMSGRGRGVYLFVLKNDREKVSRRVVLQ